MPTPQVGRNLAIVAGFGALLVVQVGIAKSMDQEPYPSIQMPAFAATADRDGIYDTRLMSMTITYEDGTTIEPNVSEFMTDFRHSSRGPAFSYMFGADDATEPEEEVIDWLTRTAAWLHPEAAPEQLEVCWYNADLDIHTATYSNASDCETERIDI